MIEDVGRDILACGDRFSNSRNGSRIGFRTLKKAAVPSEQLVRRIPRQFREGSVEKMIGLSCWRGSVMIMGMRVALKAAANGSSEACPARSLSPASRASMY